MKKEILNLEDILTDRAVEDDFIEVPLADRVFKIFLLGFVGFVIIVFGQMFNLGFFGYGLYKERALANVSDTKITPVPRGVIIDRFGEPLVKNEPAFDAFLIPRFLPQSAVERSRLLNKISEVLGIDSVELNRKIYEKNWSLSDRLLVANNIAHDQLIDLSTINLPGLQLEPSFKRVHQPPLKFSHLLGSVGLVGEDDLKNNKLFTIDDEIGRTGLDGYYDAYLRGNNGKEVFFRNALGKIEDTRIVQLAEPGLNLGTFIDRKFQEYFYDRLEAALGSLGLSGGVGIALNPQNGEILALFSIPAFDSNQIAKFLNDPQKPIFNRALTGLYNPGSTIKPLVAVAALAEGIVNPKKEIYSAGFIEVPNPYRSGESSRFLDWRAHGWVNLYSAIAKSSNVYFYEVGGGFKDQKGLGISKLKEWWQKFGLDQKTKIDLTGENAGFLPDASWKEKTTKQPWRLGDTYNVSIGQGDLTITPIGLLNYISAIANGGKFYQPRIMNFIQDENDQIVQRSKSILLKDRSSEFSSVIREVQRAMRDTVSQSYGTAYLLHGLPMSVAAKTGSAQIENNTKLNAFFVGYAPFEDPQIAILVLVENAREGSLNTLPVARDVLLWYYENRLKKRM